MQPASEIGYELPPQPDVLVWMLSAEGLGEFFSPSWLTFTGQEITACRGNGWLDAVHDDYRSRLDAAIETTCRSGGNFRQSIRLRRRDGEFVWHQCEVISRIDTSGAFVGLIGVCTDITRQIRESAEDEIGKRHFVDLLPQNDMIALAVDNAGRAIFFNQALTETLGRPAIELDKGAILSRFLDRHHTPLSETLFPAGKCRENVPALLESEYINGRDGRHVFHWRTILLRDYTGQPNGLILIGNDFTEQRHAEEQLRLTCRVFESADLAMVITDSKGTILSINSAFTRLTGYTAEEVTGRNPSILQSGRHDVAFYRAMWQSILEHGHWQGEVWDKRKDGSLYPKYLAINALYNEQGMATNYSGIFYDITERKAVEERLDRLAHFDALTELPNRTFLMDKLVNACHEAITQQRRFAVLFLDLDRFKIVNDTLGHDAGDELLRVAAKRIRESIRSHDAAGRIGGDEFAVLLSDIKNPENAAQVARKIIENFSRPLNVADTPVTLATSIGIAFCPDDAGDPETLLRLADQAMYRAKAAGRNNFRVHSG